MAKYLYGASVQGIQSFIFQTNKLQEIVGASEIVEQICTEWFFDVSNKTKDDPNLILAAAGNIKFFFEIKEDCEIVVKSFPKHVMENAPGITISQAVVEVSGENYAYEDIKKLEEQLKTQRSKPFVPLEQGYMILERARRTGGVVAQIDLTKYSSDIQDKLKKLTLPDEGTIRKVANQDNAALFKKLSGIELKDNEAKKKLPLNISDMTKSGSNSWIAVIHADGNGLGKILQKYGETIIKSNKFRKFSQAIQAATENACQIAFNEVIKNKFEDGKKYPLRPLIIGGDDVTIIIRADLALDFTNQFLKAFETESKNYFEKLEIPELQDGLSACAGICYVKDSYPLHYALQLSEALCKDAKKEVKKDVKTWRNPDYLPQSALAIFKVMDSFVEDLDDMKKRTMKTKNGINYYAGPYWIQSGNGISVEHLNSKLRILDTDVKDKKEDKRETKGVSKIRQLISESFINYENMEIMKARMKEINEDFYKKMELDSELSKNSKSILYDVINLHGFKY
jgi:hypothetical protein